jgi:hypothetical protein
MGSHTKDIMTAAEFAATQATENMQRLQQNAQKHKRMGTRLMTMFVLSTLGDGHVGMGDA